MLSKETVIQLLQHPRKVADHPEDDLRQLAEAYPYSQPLQLLYAARLRYSNEHLFQRQLGRTALITNDRSVLFELFEEQAPVQEQAHQVSESPDRDEVSPAEWAPASRPNVPPASEETPSPESPAPEPTEAPVEAAQSSGTPEAQPEPESAPPEKDPAPAVEAEKTPDAPEAAPAASAPEDTKAPPPERPPRPTARESGAELDQDRISERMKAILEKSRQLRQRQRQEAEDKLARAREEAEASRADAPKPQENPSEEENINTPPPEAQPSQQEAEATDPPSAHPEPAAHSTEPPAEEAVRPAENPDSEGPLEESISTEETRAEAEEAAPSLEEEAQVDENAPAQRETLTTSETLDDGKPERRPSPAAPDPEEESIDQKLRSIRQRLEAIQGEAAEEPEAESLEESALQEETQADDTPLLTTGDLDPEAEAAESAPPSASIPPSSDEPENTSGPAAETPQEDYAPGDEASLDEEFLEIEALIDQYRQEEVPRLVDEASAPAESKSDSTREEPSEPEGPSAVEKPAEGEAQPHSFTYWLKRLAGQSSGPASGKKEKSVSQEAQEIEEKFAPDSTREPTREETQPSRHTEDMSMEQKLQLLDSFVEKLPELKKKKPGGTPPPEDKPVPERPLKTPDKPKEEEGALVTETLAKVYIRQKHYKKAIQAYEILKLKYPEKSSFFAARIAEIKELTNSK